MGTSLSLLKGCCNSWQLGSTCLAWMDSKVPGCGDLSGLTVGPRRTRLDTWIHGVCDLGRSVFWWRLADVGRHAQGLLVITEGTSRLGFLRSEGWCWRSLLLQYWGQASQYVVVAAVVFTRCHSGLATHLACWVHRGVAGSICSQPTMPICYGG